jgi:hypothetical protein
MRILAVLCCLFSSSCFAQICFIHIAKTGGTTMHSLLQQQFTEADFYPYRNIREAYPYKGLDESRAIFEAIACSTAKPLSAHTIISGHFPFWWLQKKGLDPAAFRFTVLRDPVDRVISHFFFKHKMGETHFKSTDRTPVDLFPNLMCHMLTSDPTLSGEELLQNALQNLENLDFIIFLDDFERGVRRLFDKIGLAYTKKIPKLNETPRYLEFDPATLQKIRERNDLDCRLYEYASRFLRHKS